MKISVIICTYNPRRDYLERVLKALKVQTLPFDQWELIVVDNQSVPSVLSWLDFSWHPLGSILSEPRAGQTWARICGIQNAKSSLLVFVDDDNILDEKYLENALAIANQYPLVGAFAGNVKLVFEKSPPEWLTDYQGSLAARIVSDPVWSNEVTANCVPNGAGLIVQRKVAESWSTRVMADSYISEIGRKKGALLSADDTMLSLSTLKVKLGFGLFPELKIAHLIPETRTSVKYMGKLIRGISYSNHILIFAGWRPLQKYPVWKGLIAILLAVRKGWPHFYFKFLYLLGYFQAKRLAARLSIKD